MPDLEPYDVSWSVLVQRLGDETVVLEKDSETVLATASIGKILLLVTVAQLLHLADSGVPDGTDGYGDQLLDRREGLAVADSGIWQHLKSDRLPLHDVAALVGATSDNWATNALIQTVGLPVVSQTAERLGLQRTALHDFVRDERTSEHPPHLSSSNAADLVSLVSAIYSGTGMDRSASHRVQKWLSINTDLSMVAAAFGLDPLAHADADRGLRLWNKTGTNVGVRCDVGLLQTSDNAVAYAVLANWTPADSLDPTRDAVLRQMRAIGELVLQAARSAG